MENLEVEIEGILSSVTLPDIGSILSNEIFVAFALLSALGGVLMLVKKSSGILYSLSRKVLFDEVTLYSENPSLQYLETWIYRNKDMSKRRKVIISPMRSEDDNDPFMSSSAQEGYYYSLGVGVHFFMVKGRIVLLTKSSEIAKTGRRMDEAKVRIFGFNGKSVLLGCISEEIRKERSEDILKVYPSASSGFYSGTKTKRRPIDTVFCNDGIKEYLLDDLNKFIKREEWYTERGIAYRRGYLLAGPPGTGKTSLIKAIVATISNKVFTINLANISGDGCLSSTFRDANENNGEGITFIVLEDVDCVTASHSREGMTADRPNTEVTLQGLLNVIDGMASTENVVIFMTSNHVDNLDPALIRPGRVDVHVVLDLWNVYTIQKYLKTFYEKEEYSFNFNPEIRLSGAQVQGICMKSSTIEHAISEIRKEAKNAAVS